MTALKSMLRGLVAWLDRKFPDRVVVTQLQYDSLVQSFNGMSGNVADLTARVVKLEFEANKFNLAMGYGTHGNALAGSLER
jgi:hypothetical protein